MGSKQAEAPKLCLMDRIDKARLLLLLHALVYMILLASWVVELVVNSPTLEASRTDKYGLAMQVSAAIAAYGFVALSIYIVHSGVHLALKYDTTLQVQSFAEGVDTGCRMYMHISLGCALATAAIELLAPAYLSRSPEMQLCMHMLLFSSLFDMIMRNFWLPMMKQRTSKSQKPRMQPYFARLGPWFSFFFGAVAPLLSYFVDVRVLFLSAAMGFLGTPIFLFCITVPMVYRKTVWLLKGKCCSSSHHEHAASRQPTHRSRMSWCCDVSSALPNMYNVAPAPEMVKQGMRNTMKHFKWVIGIPIFISCLTGVAYVTLVVRDGGCLLSKLASGSHGELLPRFSMQVGDAGELCRRSASNMYWAAKHVLAFWFLFSSIAAIVAMYCAHLLVHMHTLVSELQNMQQQAAGMLRFLSHECRSPLFVVLLILHNLIEAGVPDVETSLVRAAAGDSAAAQTAGGQLGELSKQLTRMQKPLQLLRNVLDNMLSYLKLKQKRRKRSAGRFCPSESCPQGTVEGEEPMHLDAGAVMTEIGSMFPVLVDAMECKQPNIVSTFHITCCRCPECTNAHPRINSSRTEGTLNSLQCLPIWATVQETTLKQALTNLLTNAVKYGGNGSDPADITVDVTLESSACASCSEAPTLDGHPSMLTSQSSGASSGGIGGGGGSLIIGPSGKAMPILPQEPLTDKARDAGHVSISVQAPAHSSVEPLQGIAALDSGTASAVGEGGSAFYLSGGSTLPLDSSRAKLVITVSDDGKGLSQEDLALLFRPFERLRAGQEQQGTGLGLWLMHELLDFQGGTITVSSEGVGRGSQFRIIIPCFIENRAFYHLLDSDDPGAALVSSAVELPAASSTALSVSSRGNVSDAGSSGTPESSMAIIDGKTPPHRSDASTASPSGTAAMLEGLYPNVPVVEALGGGPEPQLTQAGGTVRVDTSASLRSAPAVGSNSARPGLRRVLLVDDSKAVLQQLANALKRRGFKVTKATDGQAGLEKMQSASEPFDLVVCDFEMPRMNGPELAAALRDAGPSTASSLGTSTPTSMSHGRSSGDTALDASGIEVDLAGGGGEPPPLIGPSGAAAATVDSDEGKASVPFGTGFSSHSLHGLPGLKRGTPTIFIGLTGNAMGSDVLHFKQSGAHAVLIKPANPATICSTATELQSAFAQGGRK